VPATRRAFLALIAVSPFLSFAIGRVVMIRRHAPGRAAETTRYLDRDVLVTYSSEPGVTYYGSRATLETGSHGWRLYS
jgi:hypothetical protein